MALSPAITELDGQRQQTGIEAGRDLHQAPGEAQVEQTALAVFLE